MQRGRKGTVLYFASAAVLAAPALGFGAPSTWTYNGGNAAWTADWLVASNWSFVGVPNSTLSTATFPSSSIAGGSGTVLLNAAGATVGALYFVGTGTASSNNYTLGGTGSLTLPDSGTISVSAAGALDLGIATISLSLRTPAGATIFKTGEGTLVLGGSNGFGAASAFQASSGTVRITSSSALTGLTMITTTGDGQVELQNVSMVGSVTMAGLGSSVPKSTGVISSSVGNNAWAGNWFIVSADQSVGVSAGGTLTLNGSIIDTTDPAYNGFTKVGAGSFILNSALGLSGQLNVNGGAFVLKQGTSTSTAGSVHSLAIAGGTTPTARLDISDNRLIVGNNNVSTIRGLIQAGYDGGAWDGNGIASAVAQTDAAAHLGTSTLGIGYVLGSQVSTFGGKTIGASDIGLMLAKVGDTNLDGSVDLTTDFVNLVHGHQFSGTSWLDGDFNYDGVVDMNTDFARFAAAYLASPGGAEAPLMNAIATSVLSPADQQTAQQIVTSIVPEPATLGGLAIGTGLLGIRRRRR